MSKSDLEVTVPNAGELDQSPIEDMREAQRVCRLTSTSSGAEPPEGGIHDKDGSSVDDIDSGRESRSDGGGAIGREGDAEEGRRGGGGDRDELGGAEGGAEGGGGLVARKDG